MSEMKTDILTIEMDLKSIVSDNVDLGVRMTNVTLTLKENDRLSNLIEEVCRIMVTGIKRKLYDTQESEEEK